MYSTQGKRKKRVPSGAGKAKKPFRGPPAAAQAQPRGIIPGLLYQTQTEKKVLFSGTSDPVFGPLALAVNGNLISINLIQVGSSMFNRIGRKIEMRSVRLTARLSTLNVTRATITPDIGRVMIIYDRQTNGAFPAVQDILQDTDQAGNNTIDGGLSGLNMDNRERFVTIMDKKITIPQATNTAGVLTNIFPNDNTLPVVMDEFRKLRGLTTHFKADSQPAVIGDISTGGLYILTTAQVQVGGTELFQLDWNCRLKYVDV